MKTKFELCVHCYLEGCDTDRRIQKRISEFLDQKCPDLKKEILKLYDGPLRKEAYGFVYLNYRRTRYARLVESVVCTTILNGKKVFTTDDGVAGGFEDILVWAGSASHLHKNHATLVNKVNTMLTFLQGLVADGEVLSAEDNHLLAILRLISGDALLKDRTSVSELPLHSPERKASTMACRVLDTLVLQCLGRHSITYASLTRQ